MSSWVNCTRRSWEFYNDLKALLPSSSPINMVVSGKQWGLGCNSIHLLDLLAYLSGTSNDIRIDTSQLDKKILASKRSGYVEFTGTLNGKLGNNSFKFISTMDDSESQIRIYNDVFNCIISENPPVGHAEIKIKDKNNIYNELNIQFNVPYQSRLTNHVVENILNTGTCSLTQYEESMRLHLPLITAFLDKIRLDLGPTDVCNIT